MKEVEVKARVRNKAELLAKIEALGIKLSEPIVQADTLFFPPDFVSLPSPVGMPAVRIRRQGAKNILTLKVPLTQGLNKEEHETEVADPDVMKEIILRMGFREIIGYTKRRRKGKYQHWEICVDEVEGLGDYVEMEEMTADGDSEQIQKNLFEFLKTLGISDDDREFEGYDVIKWKKERA